MFKFLKEKIKDAVSNISKKVEEEKIVEEVTKQVEETQTPEQEADEVTIEADIEEPGKQEESKEEKKQGFFSKLFKKKEEKAEEEIKEIEEQAEELEEIEEELEEEQKPLEVDEEGRVEPVIEEPQKEGLFSKIKQKILTTEISEEKFESLFEELEFALLENNVAVEVIDKMKEDLKKELVNKPIKRGEISSIVLESLRKSIDSLLTFETINFEKRIKEKKPFILCFVGINGSGKTTTIAKVARLLQKKNLSCVLAAADTFRAAAIEQLEEHANNLNLKIIKHNYGSDSAAVAFDTIKHAEAKKIDVVLIDTAGRLHSNKGLIDELKKLIRVAKPDLTIFVGESITGNDCVEQAKQFNEEIGIDGIILTKADVDEKGGAALSVSYITKKPILFLGTGQGYDSLEEFDKEKILKNLGF